MGHRGQELTRARAPQDGWTPLFIAAYTGHLAVVEHLVAKGADTNAGNPVRERMGGGVGRSRGVFGARLLSVSVLTRVGGPSITNGRRLNDEVDSRSV